MSWFGSDDHLLCDFCLQMCPPEPVTEPWPVTGRTAATQRKSPAERDSIHICARCPRHLITTCGGREIRDQAQRNQQRFDAEQRLIKEAGEAALGRLS
jgi:hypothetical protein